MESSLKASLENCLKSLKLPTMLSEYSNVASLGLEEKYSYEQYLWHLGRKEMDQRLNHRIKALLNQAKFPKVKTLDDFDFSKITIRRESIFQLCHGGFLRDFENIIFFGIPGSGKTHLGLGIGRELCLKGYRVLFHTGCSLVQELVKAKNTLGLTKFFKKMMSFDLVIIDELGYIPFERSEGDLLFQFISNRYEIKSLLITTNLAFKEWECLFNDKVLAGAAIDRLVHHSQIFKFEKEKSYRTEAAQKRLNKEP